MRSELVSVAFALLLIIQEKTLPQAFRYIKSQRPPPPTCQTPLTLRVVPHAANHSAEQPSTPGDPHKLVRSSFARHSFTHAKGCRVARQHLCFDGQAVNGYVLAARAQEPSVGTADRWPATWRVQIQAVRAAVARSMSPRCAAVPTDASRSVWSALKSSSDVGTGGPATRGIEADAPPTRPGHWDACGALGEL